MNYNLINYAIGATTFAGIKNNLNSTANPLATNDSSQGYGVGSVWINSTTGAIYIATSVAPGAANWVVTSGGGGGTLVQDNFAAVTNPAAANDSTQGYAVGSHWVNTATQEVFVCANAAAGAAVWTYVSNPSNAKVTVSTVAPGVGDNLSTGYSASAMWVDNVANKVYVCISSTTTSAVWSEITNTSTPLLNPTATLNPVPANDNTQGYGVGSIWVNTSTNDSFLAVDVTTGAAVWKSLSNASANLTAVAAPAAINDSTQGYSVSSIWVDNTNNDVYICLSAIAANAVWLLISPEVHNAYASTVAPTPADDITAGYDIGSVWIVSANDNAYICTSNTAANAVWVEITKPIFHNLTAAVTPSATNDSSQGYAPTSLWIDTTTNVVYMNTSATVGAAVWVAIGSTMTAANQSTSILIRTGVSPTVNDDVLDGYMPGAVWVDTTNNIAYICLTSAVGTAQWQPIGSIGAGTTTPAAPTGNNFAATTDPTVNDDSSGGYAVGSFWVNVTLDTSFICADATAGAAVWHQIDAAAGSSITNNFAATAAPSATDSAPTYSVGSVWIDVTNNKSYTCVDSTATSAIWVETSPAPTIKNNFAATAAPTASASVTAGYSVGSMWVDTTNNKSYICVDSTSAAAVWKETSPASSGNLNATTDPTASNSAPTYSVGSMWVNVTTDKVFICVDATATSAIWHQVDFLPKNNLTATAAPTATDDTSAGYTIGSRWLNTTTNDLYICTSNTTGSAVWVNPAIKNNLAATAAPAATNDGTQGYQPSSLWIATVGGVSDAYICTSSTTNAATWFQITSSSEAINNLAAVIAPTSSNDGTQGYSVSSHWFDTSTENLYICTSAATGAATWVAVSNDKVHKFNAATDPTTASDSTLFYETGSIWYSSASQSLFICRDATANAAVWVKVSSVKDNTAATTAPAASNDSSAAQGYSVGSLWIDTTANEAYVCLDSTVASAIWSRIDNTLPKYNLNGTAAPGNSQNSGAGYSVNSLWYNSTSRDLYVCTAVTATTASWTLVSQEYKSNFTATSDPLTSNDSTQGYEIGSSWVNTTTKQMFFCTDATSGNATWKNVSLTSGKASTFDIINITSTITAGTVITTTTKLGLTAADFNAGTVVVLLNGFEQVKGTEVIWVSNTSFKLSIDIYSGDVITVKP